MASIHKEILVDLAPARVWDAITDLGALHTRLVKGFVTDTQLDGNIRTVTFANGKVAKETIVDIDHDRRRLCYSAAGDFLSHHNASVQVFAAGNDKSRVVWIADLLPNTAAPAVFGMMDVGMQAMKRTLEASS